MPKPQPLAAKPPQSPLDSSSPVSNVKEDEVESPRPDPDELSEGTKISASTEASREEKSEPISDKKKDGSGERPVRQKLKETSLASAAEFPTHPEKQAPENEDERGRLRRKRSYDESRDDEGAEGEDKKEDEGVHRRKRSRSSKAEDEPEKSTQQTEIKENRERTPSQQRVPSGDTEKILSPKKKRSRDQLDKDDQKDERSEIQHKAKEVIENSEKPNAFANNRTSEGEPEKKRHRDESRERDAATKVCIFCSCVSFRKGLLTQYIGVPAKPVREYLSSFPFCQPTDLQIK